LLSDLVLYCTSQKGITWKITDFGFSSVARIPLPKPLSFGRMTRNYLAPELIISSRYDNKVDIWSAGCILYELATGEAAFETDEAVREFAWSGKEFSDIAKQRGAIDGAIGEMVGRMLSVSPEMRPIAASVLKDTPKV
jgi:serine/threonine protein kinase